MVSLWPQPAPPVPAERRQLRLLPDGGWIRQGRAAQLSVVPGGVSGRHAVCGRPGEHPHPGGAPQPAAHRYGDVEQHPDGLQREP